MTRLSLDELRSLIVCNLDGEFRTPSAFYDAAICHGHKLGLNGWDRVALVLERLANDGEAEIRIRGNRRTFRRVE